MRRAEGFTLVELIAVLVVLAVIGTMGTRFVVIAMESYQTSVSRSKLITQGRLALERMSRELRLALPNSVRVSNAGRCIEFMPLVAAGTYLATLPDDSNGAPAVSSVDTGGYQLGLGAARYLVVGALTANELYGNQSDAALLSSAETHADNLISLAFSHRFNRNSVSRRFYLVDNPAAFCLSGGGLRYYSQYATPSTTTGTPGGAGLLLADSVSSDSPFVVSAGTEERNTVIAMALTFIRGTEAATLQQQVTIRNVP